MSEERIILTQQVFLCAILPRVHNHVYNVLYSDYFYNILFL